VQDYSTSNIEATVSQARFGFTHEEAFLVDNQTVINWWISPCMKHLIIKIRDKDIFTDDYNYYVKAINREQEDIFKTYQNDMYEIRGMDEKNESGLVFLGEDYFAIPSMIENEDSEDEEDDEDDSEHSECDDHNNDGEKKEEKSDDMEAGFAIHRLLDGTQMCFLPDNNDFKFLKNSTKGVKEGAVVTGILDSKTGRIYEVNIRTILHLGAYQLHINKDDKILKNELDTYIANQIKDAKINDETIHVLSLHAPGLFFQTLS
jgi:hypothetical protein